MIKFNKFSLLGFFRISLIVVLISLFVSPFNLYADQRETEKNRDKVRKSLGIYLITQNDPVTSVMNINNITSFVDNKGFHNWVIGQSWNGTYPKGTAGVVYAEGIVWGGKVKDGDSPEIRVGGNTYISGTSAVDRLYRVRPDYQTASLIDDAANFFIKAQSEVSDGDVQQIRAQYAKDWQEWPADKGAPFDDVDGDGVYNPNVDIPGIPGASQTLWIHYNDANAVNIYGSPPIGLEVQETYWAYAVANPLGDAIFKKVNLVYAGTANTPGNAVIEDMYLAQWSDTDLGTYSDDFVACDTALNLGYTYNSLTTDATYLSLGMAPPAAGYDFLQGVSQYTGNPNDSAIVNLKWRKGYKYVNEKPLSTFVYFAAGGAWSDPELQDYVGTLQWYNLLRGYQPLETQTEFPHPSGGTVGGDGTYLLDGDPVLGTDWLDGVVETAGDRRMVNVTGPFNLAKGDTAEIVVALLGGLGSNNITSISVLKFADRFVQFAYDNLFDLPIFPAPTVKVSNLDNQVVLNWGSNLANVAAVEGAEPNGYKFQGYNVYQLPTPSASLSSAIKIATYDVIDEITTILDDQLDQQSGEVLKLPVQVGKNSGIQRAIVITEDKVRNNKLRNGQEYYFAVTAYGYNPDETLPYNALESSLGVITAIPQPPKPGDRLGAGVGSSVEYEHVGTANASLDIKVIDPEALTGNQYEVFFDQQHYYLAADGTWKKSNYPDSIGVTKGGKFGRVSDVSPSTMSGVGVYAETPGTINLKMTIDLQSPDYDYIDGVKLTFPNGIVLNSASTVDNCANGEIEPGVIMGQTVMWGNNDTTTFGCFDGNQLLELNVSSFTPPLSIEYILYDDGWATDYGSPYDTLGGGIVHAEGTFEITEITHQFVTQKHWNVRDLVTGEVVLEDQTVLGGTDIYANVLGPGGSSGLGSDVGVNANNIVDGMLIALDGSYAAPTTLSIDRSESIMNGDYDMDDFTIFGYPDGTAATSLPLYGGAGGTTDIDILQLDYELRWTGIEGDTLINGNTVHITKSGGSYATIFGASGYSIADHPLNPNPGSTDPFVIRIPFEVWNIDNEEQINLLIWDRNFNGENNPTQSGYKVWNTDDREYIWAVNTSYSTNPIDPESQTVADNATWNWVFFESHYETGDIIRISYANPLQLGVDKFLFNAPDGISFSGDRQKADVAKINVFPNPYYGTHYRELTRQGKYVTFSHLPQKATIRIFDLSGVLVRTINKDDNSQFIRWELTNNNNYPVASGIYVVHVDMPEIGSSKILKLAIIQEEQILNVY